MKLLLPISLVIAGSCPALAQDNDQIGFTIYGQINRAILSYDDGDGRETYPLVDNSKSVSRIGVTYDGAWIDGWRFHARGELALKKRETNRVSRQDPWDEDYKLDRTEIRKIEASFEHADLGTFSFGQGAMSADGITGMDLSLTTVVAGTPVQDAAGGQFLVPRDGQNSRVRIKQAFRSLGSSRRLRFRYDAPIRHGVRFVMAAGQEVLSYENSQKYADTSLRYDGDHGDIRVRVGAALRWIEEKPNVFIASGSILHRPSGWNASLAMGREQGGGHYGYAKLGYIAKWFDFGVTALSIDSYFGDNIAGRDGESRSYGLAVVQKLKNPKMDFYALYRQYDYDTPKNSFKSASGILAGVRWRF